MLVSDTGIMKNYTQGPEVGSTPTLDTTSRPAKVRSSVLVGSLVTLVVGGSLAIALPSFASLQSGHVGTTELVKTHTVAITTSNSTTTTTVAPATTEATTTSVVSIAATTSSTPATTTTVRDQSTPAKSVAHAERNVAPTPAKKSTPAPIKASTSSSSSTPAPTPTTTTPAPKPSAVASSSVRLTLGANITPSPNFMVAGSGTYVNGVATYENPCITPQSTWPVFANDTACTNYILQAINNARAVEGVPAMHLPSNWYSLTPQQQLFVIADLERVDRGLAPYLGLNAALSAEAQHSAQTNSDPGVAAGFAIGNNAQGTPAMGGAWGGGFSVLATDYVWMYLDGWAGSRAQTSNIACTSPGDPGCWAHREELLGTAPHFNPGVGLAAANAEMGTGFAVVAGHASLVDLIELPKSGQPAMYFTWAQNVAPFL